MSVPGAVHRPSGVDEVRVSAASREMSRPPQLKFADNQQEREFYIAEKRRVEDELSQLKQAHARDKQAASAQSRTTTEWRANASAVDLDYAAKRTVLTQQLTQLARLTQAVNLRIRQQHARDEQLRQQTQRVEDQDHAAVFRADGSVNQGAVLLQILSELRTLNSRLAGQESK